MGQEKIVALSNAKLIALRKQVILNSVFVSDYENNLGINAKDACAFFEGYVSYLEEMADENGFDWQNKDHFDLFKEYDTKANLMSWRDCVDCGLGA